MAAKRKVRGKMTIQRVCLCVRGGGGDDGFMVERERKETQEKLTKKREHVE